MNTTAEDRPWWMLGAHQISLRSCDVDYVDETSEGYECSGITERLTLLVKLKPSITQFAANSDLLSQVTMPKNGASFVPKGLEIREIAAPGASEMMLFHFRLQDFYALLGDDDVSLLDDYRNDITDGALGQLGLEVRRSLMSGRTEGEAYLEHLTAAFAFRHIALLKSKPVFTPERPWISLAVKKKVDAYIDAHLDTPIALTDLAALVDLPLRRLHDGLRASTGTTLYQIILDKRIARAREMLANTDETVASIAYACGFSSQQHMTNTFTSKLGVSPGRYRREVAR